MISPQYTPFNGCEVRSALRINQETYIEALYSGHLARSLHFEGRVSAATAMHCFTDVVRFNTLQRINLTENVGADFIDEVDDVIDELCFLSEIDDDLSNLMHDFEIEKIMIYLGDRYYSEFGLASGSCGHPDGRMLLQVITAWCWCERELGICLSTNQMRIDANPSEVQEIIYDANP